MKLSDFWPAKIRNHDGQTLKAGCAVIKDGKLLVITTRERGYWNLPKGHAEKGETAEQTALRETAEETGYKVKIIRELGDLQYDHLLNKEPISFRIFLAEVVSQDGNGEGAWRWIDLKDAAKDLYPNVAEFLEAKL